MHRFPKPAGVSALPRVCIVTAEMVGPFKNGGIGTSMTGLAQHLAASGFAVTVLYTGANALGSEVRLWRELYRDIGIAFEPLDRSMSGTLAGPVSSRGFSTPYLVYRHLRDRDFQVINFNDCMGDGFYCLAMKRLGAAFRGCALLVGLHSPSQWIFELNRTPPSLLLFSAFNFAERLSVRLADLLWSPSRYLLDWTRLRGFAHPQRTVVQRYVLPSLPLFQPAQSDEGGARPPPEGDPLTEIVFFGRLEERKGLRLFCRALHKIGPELAARGISVVFLGKSGAVGNQSATEFLEATARSWRFPWKQISDLGQQEALEWLLSRPALAVIASPADNSPCTVYEALALGIPFIAARTGGIPELIAEPDHAWCLFDHNPDDLSLRLLEALDRGVRRVTPAEAPDETRERWIGGFEAWADYVEPNATGDVVKRLCVLVDGRDDKAFDETLASLETMQVSRVLLIARSSAHHNFRTSLPVTVVQADEPEYLAAALGDDAGEIVLMMRNGTLLSEDAAKDLIGAFASSEPDGLVPAATAGSGGKLRTIIPLGGSASFCLYEGASTSGVMAIRADRLAAAIRGRELPRETEFLGVADFAVAAGLDIWPFPEPLVHHPHGYIAERAGRSARERLAAYSEADATERLYMAASGYEEFATRVGLAGALRAVRQQLVILGLGKITDKLVARTPERLRTRLRRAGRA